MISVGADRRGRVLPPGDPPCRRGLPCRAGRRPGPGPFGRQRAGARAASEIRMRLRPRCADFRAPKVREDLGDLKCARDATPHPARRQEVGDVLSIENNAARTRLQKSADQVEERGLTGPIGADDSPQFTRFHRHRHIVDGNEIAETPGDTLDPQQTHGVAFHRMMPSTPRGKHSTTSTKNRPIKDIQSASRSTRNPATRQRSPRRSAAPRNCASRRAPP